MLHCQGDSDQNSFNTHVSANCLLQVWVITTQDRQTDRQTDKQDNNWWHPSIDNKLDPGGIPPGSSFFSPYPSDKQTCRMIEWWTPQLLIIKKIYIFFHVCRYMYAEDSMLNVLIHGKGSVHGIWVPGWFPVMGTWLWLAPLTAFYRCAVWMDSWLWLMYMYMYSSHKHCVCVCVSCVRVCVCAWASSFNLLFALA